MIWGIDPWFLAALIIWAALAPVGGVIVGWRIARDRTIRPAGAVHSPREPVNGAGGTPAGSLWDRLAPRSWRP